MDYSITTHDHYTAAFSGISVHRHQTRHQPRAASAAVRPRPRPLQGHWLLAGIGKRVLRILRNVLGNKDIRARVLNMKHTFDKYRNELTGIAFVVRKPEA